jgi:hypothetical protein
MDVDTGTEISLGVKPYARTHEALSKPYMVAKGHAGQCHSNAVRETNVRAAGMLVHIFVLLRLPVCPNLHLDGSHAA